MHNPIRIVPHARTLRKAREQIKLMVFDGLSAKRIKRYLLRWLQWWAMTSTTWQYQELLQWFIDVCWNQNVAAYATALQQFYIKELHTRMFSLVGVAAKVR